MRSGGLAQATLLATIGMCTCGGETAVVEAPGEEPVLCGVVARNASREPIGSALRTHPSNSRYFMDSVGRPVLLAGSHHWQNLQHRNNGEFSNPEYAEYLDCLDAWGHNFIRLWVWEDMQNEPLPWARTGPGNARDGKSRFDLTRFDETYFQRLRERVQAARDRGIYVAIMLFQGWSVEGKTAQREIWSLHPLHADNNVNGIDGDANGNGQGREVHTLGNPAITGVQEAYVRRVVDTVHDLANVLYEISNESDGDSHTWQTRMVEVIRSQEASGGSRHPVGLTVQWPRGSNQRLLSSSADWISPNDPSSQGDYSYTFDPPPAGGGKVVIVDSDHLAGDQDADWVWKTFFRGMNPILMDHLESDPEWLRTRIAMGRAIELSRRIDLARLVPVTDPVSSQYALADVTEGSEMVVYAPTGTVDVELSDLRGPLSVEWFDVEAGTFQSAGTVPATGALSFQAPFTGAAVLHLRTAGT